MKRFLAAICITTFLFPTTTWASQENWAIEGQTKIQKAQETVNINPYNIATISGVGEQDGLTIMDTTKTFTIPFAMPLYQLSSIYKDQFYCNGGIWGVERKVGVKVFDGTENWKLVKNFASSNENTTLFSCDTTEHALFWDGICTHFDVFLPWTQQKNRYDGISFGEDLSQIQMRIMNVRNVKTVEDLKKYLKAQKDAGHPVKFFYVRKEPVFEPFDAEMQKTLNQIDWDTVGFLEPNFQGVTTPSASEGNTKLFLSSPRKSEPMKRFLSAIEEIHIYHSTEGERFYLEGIYPTNRGFDLCIKEKGGATLRGTVAFSGQQCLSNKPIQVSLAEITGGPRTITLKLNCAKVDFPQNPLAGFSLEDTEIRSECMEKPTLVVPSQIPVMEDTQTKYYFQNAILYGDEKETPLQLKSNSNQVQWQKEVATVEPEQEKTMTSTISLEGKAEGVQVQWIPVSKQAGAGKERTILCLGDSLLNQDLYTEYLAKELETDPLQVTLLGTRGVDGAKHEGRGGWSAYDYCRVNTKYGFENPFLNQGVFDFSYYMKQYDACPLDEVVINLGINDLNLVGHNDHDEIIGYYHEMIESIRAYDSDTKILLNLPALLFESSGTKTAKEERLELIQTIKRVFGNQEEQGIYLVPIYLSIDPWMGYKFMEPSVNEQSQNYGMTVQDTTHPNHAGYQSIAHMTYTYLKYLEMQEETR